MSVGERYFRSVGKGEDFWRDQRRRRRRREGRRNAPKGKIEAMILLQEKLNLTFGRQESEFLGPVYE